ncbi:MAG: ceramidase domain-containing protein [Acidimicrobiia bacterium]|nr:ceramidase domain-containing protein [Acidimicrobiia bacterium]MDX2467269.1 ceramidase domain-containing protein [Acidimicrobiia bacterium]
MNRHYRPLLITLGFLALFFVSAILVGQGGWGDPAENEQAIGEVSRWCERVNGGFLREPVNTLGNLGFVVAGLLMFWVLARDSITGRPAGTSRARFRGESFGSSRPANSARIERRSTAPTPNRMIGHTPISLLYAAAAVFLGPGSMVMHGTHTFFGAWIDNVSMVLYVSIPWLLNLSVMGRWRDRKLFITYTAVVTAYALGYWFIGADLGIGFELFRVSIPIWLISEALYRWWSPTMRWASGFLGFVVAAAFGITPITMVNNIGEYWWVFLFWLPGLLATNSPPGQRTYTPWFWAGIASFLLAYAIWLTGTADHEWCRPDSLIQAHAIWHMLSALATWCFFVFLRTEVPLPSPHDAVREVQI